MRAGGSNITTKHTEEISLSGLFLMEVTKKIDQEFGVHHSTKHTTTDAWNDVKTIANHLIENSGDSPSFRDPTISGLEKMFNSTWIQNTLNRTELFEESTEEMDSTNRGTVDTLYELTDTL